MEAQGWAAGAQGEQSPAPGASLRVDERPGPLPEAKAFGPEVLGVATFAVDLPIFVCQGGGLQALATLGAAEAGLVPGLWDRRGTRSGGNGDETAKLWYHVGSLWRLCF